MNSSGYKLTIVIAVYCALISLQASQCSRQYVALSNDEISAIPQTSRQIGSPCDAPETGDMHEIVAYQVEENEAPQAEEKTSAADSSQCACRKMTDDVAINQVPAGQGSLEKPSDKRQTKKYRTITITIPEDFESVAQTVVETKTGGDSLVTESTDKPASSQAKVEKPVDESANLENDAKVEEAEVEQPKLKEQKPSQKKGAKKTKSEEKRRSKRDAKKKENFGKKAKQVKSSNKENKRKTKGNKEKK